MKNINIKKVLLFISFVFITFIALNVFYNNVAIDPITQYTMSHAFVSGEVPYVDFNMMVPPFFVVFYGFFLLIFDDIITVLFVNSVLIVILFYLFYKILDNKWFMAPVVLSITAFTVYYQLYNFLFFFLVVLVIYLEKIDFRNKDYLIGFLLGLLLFTKHTIGITVIIMSLIYIKDLSKIKKRIIGVLSVCILFVLYFIRNNNILNFMDLCVIGLLDFGNSNAHCSSVFRIVIVLAITLIALYKIIKKKNYIYYYVIGCLPFCIPLMDNNHIAFYSSMLVIALLYDFKLGKDKASLYKYLSIFLFIGIFILNLLARVDFYRNIRFLNMNHFRYLIVNNNYYDLLKEYNKKYHQYDNVITVGMDGAMINTINDDDITFFGNFSTGNFGYNGDNKMIKRIKESKDTYYIITNDAQTGKFTQYPFKIRSYIQNNLKKIDTFYDYDIYYKK